MASTNGFVLIISGGLRHLTTIELTCVAGVLVSLKRHLCKKRAAPRKEKCSPCTTTAVPPPVRPVMGDTYETKTGASYSNTAHAWQAQDSVSQPRCIV